MSDIDRTTFREEVRAAGSHLSPVRAGLLFAREIAYPDLRPSDYLVLLDDWAAAAHRFVGPHTSAGARGRALAEYLFQVIGLRGDVADYYNPLNSYLNKVLDRKLGIPISLSVIYLEMGQRLGLPVAGVGMPGHFIISMGGDAGPLFLDPYHQGRPLRLEDCADLVRRATGFGGAFDRRWLAPTAPRQIVERMLNNLRNFYVQMEDWPLAIRVVERLRELQPDVSAHLRDLGLLHYRAESLRRALQLLDEYLTREPAAPDTDSVRQSRDLLLEHLGRLN
jgi:regulator of sirC expression with transglutaminase-like and TPR domain